MLAFLKKKVANYLRAVVREGMTEALEEDSTQIYRHLRRQAAASSARFVVENISLEKGVADREALFDVGLDQAAPGGLILEFGVYKGLSIRYIASKVPGGHVYGFDSFEGLPEPWITHAPGLFKLEDRDLPQAPPNATLVKGWFQDTLPGFLGAHPGPVSFLLIDSDLYSSCRYVLETLSPRIVPGTVIVFDEFFNYPGWERGEYKAYREWVEGWDVESEFIAFTDRSSPNWWRDGSTGQQVAIKVRKIAAQRSATTAVAHATG
jgi:predicted O-methyltransferase YrrM